MSENARVEVALVVKERLDHHPDSVDLRIGRESVPRISAYSSPMMLRRRKEGRWV